MCQRATIAAIYISRLIVSATVSPRTSLENDTRVILIFGFAGLVLEAAPFRQCQVKRMVMSVVFYVLVFLVGFALYGQLTLGGIFAEARRRERHRGAIAGVESRAFSKQLVI